MAQGEPKIDSKEFELLGGGMDPVPGVADLADITIRLWSRERAGSPGALNWKTESVMVYMIADLVAASRGRVDASSSVMLAHFDSSGQALVAARRIQTAILEFLACRPGDSFVAAILIHAPSSAAGGFSAVMAQGALRLAEPGQILLSEEMARRLQDSPGIELRSVPGLTTDGNDQTGLSQLVWASPERIAQLQSFTTGQRRTEAGPPMGATMIVNAGFGGTSSGNTATSSVGATGLIPQDKAAATRTQKFNADGTASPFGADEVAPPSFFTGTRLILGLAAMVLVGALVWLFYPKAPSMPVSRGTDTSGVPTSNASGPTSGAVPNGAPVNPVDTKVDDTRPTPVDAVVNPVIPDKGKSDKPLANNSQKGKQGKNKPSETDKPVKIDEPPAPPVMVDGMTVKDIPRLLEMARSDAGSGNYDKARREYTVVVRLQPNNADAKEGLRRLDVAQSDK